MPVPLERQIQLPPDPRSPGRARRMLLAALADADADDLADTAVLLASELCENAVLHAGTEFDVEITIDPNEVVITVGDHGAGPLELHLSQARPRYGRAATHGRGLLMVQRLADSWGTRHDRDGTHRVWFVLSRGTLATPERAAPADPAPSPERLRSTAERARWLMHLPDGLAERLQPDELVAELVRRLREVLDADGVVVEIDEGDGAGPRELTRDGTTPDRDSPGEPGTITEVRLPTTPPLRGQLRVHHPASPRDADEDRDLTELIAYRVAMAVQARWLREADQHRKAWLSYLADTSELLGQSLDVDLAVAVVPQIVVPRLGLWCAVHLADDTGTLRLAALTHADEEQLTDLTAALDPAQPGELRTRLTSLMAGVTAPARFAVPTDGITVALRPRDAPIGTLTVGRPADRPHSPEDVALISDIARRAGLAIHNAQTTAAHVAVSQALQQALLPRALPLAHKLDFDADYLPASSGSDVGGDFYDVLTIDASRWLVSMGDVCGKGARAAARTGQVRDVLRVLVREGNSLARAIDLLNEVMMEAGDPLQFCTLAVAVVERPRPGQPPGLCVDLVLAGHLQPVLVRAGAGAELIGEFGTAVGLVKQVQVECTRHHLAPGDVLLLYTDGVTERRRGREQFGADRLLAAAESAAGGTAAQLVGAVRAAVEEYSTDPRDDDIALLAVRAVP